ncbi:hypothetical protein MMC13_007400 [Lambiella insularis]|nr:hypothetical protein [Lambiella insularis]
MHLNAAITCAILSCTTSALAYAHPSYNPPSSIHARSAHLSALDIRAAEAALHHRSSQPAARSLLSARRIAANPPGGWANILPNAAAKVSIGASMAKQTNAGLGNPFGRAAGLVGGGEGLLAAAKDPLSPPTSSPAQAAAAAARQRPVPASQRVGFATKMAADTQKALDPPGSHRSTAVSGAVGRVEGVAGSAIDRARGHRRMDVEVVQAVWERDAGEEA